MSDEKQEQALMSGQETGAPEDRPRRTRVLKKGKIVFQGGLRSFPCIVRNLSEGGALLQFETAFMSPPQFDLHIDLENFEVSCEKRWEDGLKIGVQFITEKRTVSAQRAQTLKTSEEALKSEIDIMHDSPDNFFTRQHMVDDQKHTRQPVRRTRPAGSGKSGFGKRR
ncbi:PilZ domain-containing protein [Roseibium sp.]|uniref:PilZ domain-containing protein n=1 Tax=Roseibium sp. TaxID=1936156 RepID=UPI003B5243A7